MSFCGLANGIIADGFCAVELPLSVSRPRSVRVHGDSDEIFVLERETQSIVHLFDSDGDGIPDSKAIVASASNLNHGLAIYDGYIYASSDSTVYRWPLYEGDIAGSVSMNYNAFPLVNEEVVVSNINEDGMGGAPLGHKTRTLEFDKSGMLYISVGSNKNVDGDSYRSRIRRFNISDPSVTFPQDFQTMEVFADGLRNEVGLAFDKHGILWGVENSADNLVREDLGGDIHEDNAEELNRFRPEDAGKHWGYPYCWTEYNLPAPTGIGRGMVWAWPSFFEDGTITDEECRNDYIAPVVPMQAHSAPLGITFFNWLPAQEVVSEACNGVKSFPEEMNGFAFIAYHGSWNRDVPTGYKVVYVQMDESGDAIGEPIDLLAHSPPNAKWEDGFRPVDVAFDSCGRLIVTSDGTRGRGAKVIRIEYIGREINGSTEASNPPDISSAAEFSSTQIYAFLFAFLMVAICS